MDKHLDKNIIFFPVNDINLTTNHYNKLLWFRELFEINFNIGFEIRIEFPSQRNKKNIQIGP